MEVLGTLGCKSERLKWWEMGERQTSAFERVFIIVRSREMRRARWVGTTHLLHGREQSVCVCAGADRWVLRKERAHRCS